MGGARSSLMLVFLLIRAQITKTEAPITGFIFRGFRGNVSEILMEGDATVKPDGLLRLTDRHSNAIGTTFYRKPVRLLESHLNSRVLSFSTSFIFTILPTSSSNGGYGLTFTISPTPYRRDADSGQYMGLLNKETDGNTRNHIFAVEFDTVPGIEDGHERPGSHIGVNFNSLTSEFKEPVFFYKNERKEEFALQAGEPIQADISYDGYTQFLNLTVYPAHINPRPVRPSLSGLVPKLSQIVEEEMYIGFTAATGKGQYSSAHYLLGWSFSSGGEHPEAAILDLSELPRPPLNTAERRGYNSQVIGLIVALSAVILILLGSLFFAIYKKRLQQGEILEDWEVNHPHRLRYTDLHYATDGFNEERIIGHGGFGTVFRGSISSSASDQIAVKKITQSSEQGIREFVAEIESLGRLSHKNLVNLRGWCKQKSSLLLVYDYIPNGSLDSLLYGVPRRTGTVLSWIMRLNIAKGIASGLLYLHEECEKIVIHRDVKPSNVMIDEDMNPRLGDFGLARLYERGSQSYTTTVIVGTLGYMAPEITCNGNSSSASDVYAFGGLLLEIVSGRKPTDYISFVLPKWVMELYASGEILHAVDWRLRCCYDSGEARLALTVGMLCCHHRPESRPSMRMVIKYLNGEENVPEIDDNWGFSDSTMSGLRSDSPSSSVASFSVRRTSSSPSLKGPCSNSVASFSISRTSSSSALSG